MTEEQVQSAAVDFMVKHGWRAIRTQFVAVVGMVSTLEPGFPDYMFIRYMPNEKIPARALVMYVEFKSPTDKRQCECMKRAVKAAQAGKRKPGKCKICRQKDWAESERAKGAVVFTSVTDVDRFIQIYYASFGWLHRDSQQVTTAGQQSLPLAGE